MAARKPTGGYDLESSLSHLLRRAQQFAYDQFVQQMGSSAITPRQFIVLFAVNEEEGLSQTDLVNRTGIDRSTLADTVQRMEKRGWISRTTAPLDARAHAVHLASSGAALLAAATQHARAADAAILDLLPRTKRRTFLNILTKLAKLSDEAAAKAERDAKREAKRAAKDEKKKKQKPAAETRRRDGARKQRS